MDQVNSQEQAALLYRHGISTLHPPGTLRPPSAQVHYLGDPSRGSVWEEAIINCPRHVQLLCMSATVKNPDDLGAWIAKVGASIPPWFLNCLAVFSGACSLPWLVSVNDLDLSTSRSHCSYQHVPCIHPPLPAPSCTGTP